MAKGFKGPKMQNQMGMMQQLQKLQTNAQPDPADLESLKLVGDALASLREPIHAGGR